MLRHPFHEILTASSSGDCPDSAIADDSQTGTFASPQIGRRSFFASVAAGAAAFAAYLVGESAYGRGRRTTNRTRTLSDATTLAMGEEGGGEVPSPPPSPSPAPPTYTTLMLGEEGGNGGGGGVDPPFTTFVVGEEG